MDTLLVDRSVSMALHFLQARSNEGVEFSISSGDRFVGVLVPVTTNTELLEILNEWGNLDNINRSLLYKVRPAFVRCDFSDGLWNGLSIYCRKDGNGIGIKLRDADTVECREYLNVRMNDRAELYELILSRFTTDNARCLAIDITNRLLEFGEMHFLVFDERHGTLTLNLKTNHMGKVLRFTYAHTPLMTPRLERFAKVTGGVPGYLGVKIDKRLNVTCRVYARSFPCSDIESMVNAVLWK